MHRDERGSSTGLLVALIVCVLLLIGVGVFAITAYNGEQDYKKNVQPKIDAAVAVAKAQTATAKDNEFVQKEKNPLKTYTGPSAYGTATIQYPKTWSAYVNEAGAASAAVDGYFHPNFVPFASQITAFALRLQVVQTPYDQLLKQYDAGVKNGTVKVSAYVAPKVPGTLGARIDGEIQPKKKGSMVMLSLRDKTLKVWTEADQFLPDFNNIILPNLTFIP